MTSKINQKEYLKKYLSSNIGGDEKKKKKRKSSKSLSKSSVKIIDDDLDLSQLQKIHDNEVEIYGAGEDAPQIVGVVDERPPELRAVEDFQNSTKWKVISHDDGFESSLTVHKVGKHDTFETFRDKDLNPIRMSTIQCDSDGDISPRRNRNEIQNQTKSRDYGKRHREKFSPNISPPRRTNKNITGASSPKKRNNITPDSSPPRRDQRIPDLSPKRNRYRSPDVSPKRRNDSDLSPSRKRRESSSPRRRNSFKHNNSDDKTRHRYVQNSPPRSKMGSNKERLLDKSPSRQKQRSNDITSKRKSLSPNKSPSRRRIEKQTKSRWESPPLYQRSSKSLENSPSRLIAKKSQSPTDEVKRMTKTLDGKTAGLQNAKALRIESDKFRQREDEIFKSLSEEVSGKNAEVVVRDRKTGKRRDFEQEALVEREKQKKIDARKAVYDRWGKGVKQVDQQNAQLADAIHEMSKPVARYADDEDLDSLLKVRERDGDPMLEYMRQKERERRKNAGEVIRPIYKDTFPDNRFSLRPGYRWDGVDRSNGYEKRYFEMLSNKKSIQEEAYRYSTEDM